MSKFIVFYEWTNVRNPTNPYQLDRFDVLAIISIPLSALGGIGVWTVFFRCLYSIRTDPEREPLLATHTTTHLYTDEPSENSANTTEDITVQIKETTSSWWRIIKLGKKEWKYYIIAFICLLIAAFSKKIDY